MNEQDEDSGTRKSSENSEGAAGRRHGSGSGDRPRYGSGPRGQRPHDEDDRSRRDDGRLRRDARGRGAQGSGEERPRYGSRRREDSAAGGGPRDDRDRARSGSGEGRERPRYGSGPRDGSRGERRSYGGDRPRGDSRDGGDLPGGRGGSRGDRPADGGDRSRGQSRDSRGRPGYGSEARGGSRGERLGSGGRDASRGGERRRDDGGRSWSSAREGGDRSRGPGRPRRDSSGRDGAGYRGRPDGDRPGHGSGPRRDARDSRDRSRGGEERRAHSPRGGAEPREFRVDRRDRPIEPEIDADVVPQMLDREARSRLRTLSKSNSDHVASHLVMAGRLIDTDPERAYQHAKVAVSSAGRVDVAREALALTAYATARYAEALREIRTVRRLSGIDAHPAVEADCERGLGRPERAIDVLIAARGLDLPEDEVVEMAIVESGARSDLGESDAGLVVVENMSARTTDRALRQRLDAVRADRLEELGRGAEAVELRATLDDIPIDVVVTDLAGDEPDAPAESNTHVEPKSEAESAPEPAATSEVTAAEPAAEPESAAEAEPEPAPAPEPAAELEPGTAPAEPAKEPATDPSVPATEEPAQLDLFDVLGAPDDDKDNA